MAREVIHTLLTTNFDAIPQEAARLLRRPHFLNVIKTPSDYTKFSTSPAYPQLVYLHGSVEHYSDRNLLEEVQRLDQALVDMLVPSLRDHPLFVVGYRGGEPSIMEHLLLGNSGACNDFRHGIYWCLLEGDANNLTLLTRSLAERIGTNFQLVYIKGFDELLADEIAPHIADIVAPPGHRAATTVPAPDFAAMEGVTLEEIDMAILRDRLISYCNALSIPPPMRDDQSGILELAEQQNLLIRNSNGTYVPSAAGYLLFGRAPQERMPSAHVLFRLKGELEWLRAVIGAGEDTDEGLIIHAEAGVAERSFSGNLWAQLDGISAALAFLNRPFRLKGEVSQTVYPYPSLALKEILVNALVHRDYLREEPVVVDVEAACIHVRNSGGLVEDVRRHLDDEPLESEIKRGHRGIKGYRNPVVADLFYGAGAMDKAGSGLVDVYVLVKENGGEVHSGPSVQNDSFAVTIFSRPEAVDVITSTASPLSVTTSKFAANVLEVLQIPRTVWHAGTSARSAAEVSLKTRAQRLPPFVFSNSRISTFHNLEASPEPFRDVLDSGDIEPSTTEEFAAGQDGERSLVELLNSSLVRHLQDRGLTVDRKRQRAHFARSDEGQVRIDYPARFRRKSRTVVKSRISKNGRILYWEHQAIGYQFEHFGNVWGLIIVPCYVFTWNGVRGYLSSARISRLATRRAARDYNGTVHNDLVFWSWMLAGGEESSFTLQVVPAAEVPTHEDRDLSWKSLPKDESAIVLASRLPTATVSEVEEVVSASVFTSDGDLEELEEELALLAEKTEQQRGTKGEVDRDQD